MKTIPVTYNGNDTITTTISTITFSTKALCGMATGIEETSANNITISIQPNPSASGNITVKWNAGVVVNRIELMDLNDRLILQHAAEQVGQTTINTSILPSGVYLVSLINTELAGWLPKKWLLPNRIY